MRRTEDGLIPTVLAIAGALQWVASWGGAWLVSATTRSTVSAGSGGRREGRVLSRVNPSIPSCMKRSCQRQTTVLPLPTARVMAVVPAPSAVRTMIRARHTCFCALLRLRMIVSSQTRSSAVTGMEIPLRITDNRTTANLQKLLFGLFCQVLSTSSSGRAYARRLIYVDHVLGCDAELHLAHNLPMQSNRTPNARRRPHSALRGDRRPRKHRCRDGLRPRRPGPRRPCLGQAEDACRRRPPRVEVPLALIKHARGRHRVLSSGSVACAGDVAYSLPSRSWIRPARRWRCTAM